MTTTTISSATREVHIGFDQPFVIIGERINPTGRKILAEEMKNGDYSRVEADALAQVEAGAHMLDVNAGIHWPTSPAFWPRPCSWCSRLPMYRSALTRLLSKLWRQASRFTRARHW